MGMFLYTSCEKNTDESIEVAKNEKRPINMVLGEVKNEEGKIVYEKKIFQSKKEGFFDIYMFGARPEGKEIAYEDLSSEEKEEFDIISKEMSAEIFTLFSLPDGTKAIYQKIDKKSKGSNDYSDSDVVPFSAIDEAPIFPGCEDAEDPKACSIGKITEHVAKNFDIKIGNNLGLESGIKKVYVQFTIGKDGKISDLRARGPHKALEVEAKRVMNELPQMRPGKNRGQDVNVKYTLPITLNID